MGYDLHITRRKQWSSKGKDITSDEWLTYVQRDPELRLQPENGPYFFVWSGGSTLECPWLDWWEGNIYTKNPDAALVEKMVAIARQLGAKVQGDDGEIYDQGSDAPRQPYLSLKARVADWFGRLRPERPLPIVHDPLPFGVGDTVRDTWGNAHVVIQIDPKAERGLGVIRTRRQDGEEITHTMIAHGLTSSVININRDRS
jgi:hypothetical protein